jgi:hypothetical protein
MDTSLLNFRSRLLEAILDLLWRQWCSLGVAGHSEPAVENGLIDPEALLLATTSLGRHEPRLFDEMFDWLSRYGFLINLQRLKNLHRNNRLGDEHVLTCIADWLVTNTTQQSWKSLAKAAKSDTAVQTLFLGSGTTFRHPDPFFLAHGLERELFRPRGMSRAPDPTLPPNLTFTLRALIGVSARVEIILCLAGGGATYASEIARTTGYAPRTLQALLQEMLLSGHILSQEPATIRSAKVRKGANRRYHLQSSDWAFLTKGRPLPQWKPWAALFSLVRETVDVVPHSEEKDKHSAVISSKLRESLAIHGQALASSGLLPALAVRSEASGEELLRTLADRLPSVIAAL